MLISDDLPYCDVYALLEAVSLRLGRTVNPTIYTPQELTKRIKRKDAFATRVLAQPSCGWSEMTMPSAFENLCGPGKPLKAEPPDANEFAGLKRSELARLKDAGTASLALESRFDLGYNAAHALCLAALRWHGYRSSNRFMLIAEDLPPGAGVTWRDRGTSGDSRAAYEHGRDAATYASAAALQASNSARRLFQLHS